MATMNSVIEYVDGVKPNTYSEEDKCAWMNRLEGMVSHTVHGETEAKRYVYPEDADRELLVPHPFDDIYALYVMAMIDFHNRDYDDYNNAMLLFTERYEAYKAWYIRNRAPDSPRNFSNVWG